MLLFRSYAPRNRAPIIFIIMEPGSLVVIIGAELLIVNTGALLLFVNTGAGLLIYHSQTYSLLLQGAELLFY